MTNARAAANRISSLLQDERATLADFLVALATFDEGRGWADLGYRSLHQYLERELKLSGGPAFYRVTAARLIRKFPSVVEPLRSGALCLTAVHAVSQVLTPENDRELLPRFFGLSRERAEELVAELRPAEHVPTRELVTRVPACDGSALSDPPPPASGALALAAAAPERTSRREVRKGTGPHHAAATVRPRDEVEPCTPDLRRVHLTVSKEFLAKLEAAKDALSHSIPSRDAEAVLSAGLDLLLEQAAKRRGLVKKPRPAPTTPSNDPRHIPAAVAREVWQRDGEKCAFRLPDGSVCGSTVRLELDHHPVPAALGGPSTPDNLRVTCAAHNALAARQVYGDLLMDRFTVRRTPRQRRPPPHLRPRPPHEPTSFGFDGALPLAPAAALPPP